MRKLLVALFCASMLAAQDYVPTKPDMPTVTAVDDLPWESHKVVAWPVKRAVPVGLTASEVRKAIAASAAALTWAPSLVDEGAIEAKLLVRTHELVVDITYTATEYTISYKSSKNLNYSEKYKIISKKAVLYQTIHGKYKVWLKNLDARIQSALQAVAVQKVLADPSDEGQAATP
jgi:hypothetical protein